MKCYVVSGIISGKRQNITNPVNSLKRAKEQAKNIKQDLRVAVAKYKWAERIKVTQDIKIKQCGGNR
jgi:hypothetical protein